MGCFFRVCQGSPILSYRDSFLETSEKAVILSESSEEQAAETYFYHLLLHAPHPLVEGYLQV